MLLVTLAILAGTLDTWGAVIGLTVGACAVAVFVGQGMRLAWKAVRGIVQIADAMPTLLAVAEQFKPNGGSSVVDAIARLELGQRALLMDKGYATLDAYLDHVARHDARTSERPAPHAHEG